MGQSSSRGRAQAAKGPALSVYSATKAAIRSFARTWTTDLKSRGIRVNTISAGMIATPGMQKYLARTPGAEEAIKAMIPFNRLGTPDEVGSAVVYLASKEASFVAGVELFVDGGVLAV